MAWTLCRWVIFAVTACALWRIADQRAQPYAWEAPILRGEMWEADELTGTSRGVWPGLSQSAHAPPLQWLMDCLRWNDGLLARPRTVLFSLPAAWTIRLLPDANPILVMRFWAWLAMMTTVFLLYRLLALLTDNDWSASIGTGAFLCWPTFWMYGSYGCSIAGTLLVVVLLWITLARYIERPTWSRSALCACAFILVSWQYAVARLVAVVALGALLWHVRHRSLLLCCGILISFCVLQGSVGRAALFHARGEQMFTAVQVVRFTRQGQIVMPLMSTDADLSTRLRKTLDKTIPELLALTGSWRTSVRTAVEPRDVVIPALPLAWLPLVIALACCACWRSFGRWFVISILTTTGAILLTTRADLHRLSVCVLMLAIVVGMGSAEAWRLLRGYPQ